MKNRLDNIHDWERFILNESEGPYVWALFAGDSMNFGIGLYANELEANEALKEYREKSILADVDDPHLERFDLSDLPQASGLFTISLSNGAQSLNDDMPESIDQVKFLLSLGASPRALFLSHQIDNNYDRLYNVFDGDLSWLGMSREEIEKSMRSINVRKNLF